MPAPIRTILFDLDETLSDHLYSLRQALLADQKEFPVLAAYDLSQLTRHYQEALEEAFTQYLEKKLTHDETKRLRVKLLFKKIAAGIPDGEIEKFLAVHGEAYLSDRRATLGAVKTLKALRELGYKIGVVTNGEEDLQTEKLRQIGIEGLIDAIITSGAVGFAKPSPEIFAAALSRLESKKEEAVMVGDNLEKDVGGALAFGMRAVLYAPSFEQPHMEKDGMRIPVISHMEQLLEYLDAQN